MILRARAHLRAVREACGLGAVLRLQGLQVATALLEAAMLGLLVPLVSALAGDRASLPVIGHLGGGVVVAVAALVVALRAAAQWATTVVAVDLRTRTVDRLRLRALDAVLAAEWSFVARRRRSEVVQATTTESERVETAVTLLLRIGIELSFLLGTALVALAISPVTGLVAVVGVGVVGIVGRRSVRQSVALGVEWSQRNQLFGATVTDSLASLRLVRAHDAAESWRGLLRSAASAGRRTERRYAEVTTGVQALLGVLAVAVAAGLVLLGRGLGLGVAALVTLAVVTVRLLSLARNVLLAAQSFAHLSPALEVLERLTREAEAAREGGPDTPSVAPRDGGSTEEGVAGGHPGAPLLELRGVAAGYGDRPAFTALDLTVRAGTFVAVTGPSGSGKSTLLDVVLGLLPPSAGALLVDGQPVRSWPAWRARLGYVPQQTVLVPGTVRDNLVWSAGRAPTDEELWAALETAAAADVVRRLPGQLDAVLLETAQLSGGEQQRLGIARALVRAPDLLVLDEATSALDEATEDTLLAGLAAWPGAVLLATHRPAGVRRAHDVVPVASPA